VIGWEEIGNPQDRRVADMLALLVNLRGPIAISDLTGAISGYPRDPAQAADAVRDDVARLAAYGLAVTWGSRDEGATVALAPEVWESRPLVLGDEEADLFDRVVELSDPLDAELAAVVEDLSDGGKPTTSDTTISLNPRTSAGPDRFDVYSRLHRLAGQLSHGIAAEFGYPDPSGEIVQRTLQVYGLGESRGIWYAVGSEPGSATIRAFRVADMRSPVMDASPPDSYRVPSDFEIAEHLALPWRLGPDPFPAHVSFDRDLAPFVVTSLPQATMEQRPDGSVRTTLTVGDPERFVGWLLTFGTHAQILGPADLREQAIAYLEGMISLNG
jgi:predicted DNA-binding transcriptional regulator YafY